MMPEEELNSSLTMPGDELDDAELDRRVTRFQGALRRLRDDPAEAHRIDALVMDAEHSQSDVRGADGFSLAQVSGIARETVRQLAPHELVVFDAVADSWARGGQRRRRRPDSAAGPGVEEILLSQLVFPIVAGALGQVLGTVLTGRRSKKSRKREPAPAVTTTAAGGPGTEDQPLMLTGPQARQFHDACLRHAQDLGMPPDKAALLADACLGAVKSRGPT